MHNLAHTAIVIKSSDYKEFDKTVRLFTLDGGMLSAVLKGVKRPNAKLKFAAQPFAFCEYTLNEKGGFYTVTGAAPLESFYALASDPDGFVCASLMCEAVDYAVSTVPSPAVFVYLLKLFKAMLYGGKSPYAAAALCLTRLRENAGYGGDAFFKEMTPESLPDASQNATCLQVLKRAVSGFENNLEVKLVAAKLLA